jgi:hypothetical protein
MTVYRPSPLERAFELADTGEYSGAPGIRLALGKEGYALDQLYGPQLLRQLRDRCQEARERAGMTGDD